MPNTDALDSNFTTINNDRNRMKTNIYLSAENRYLGATGNWIAESKTGYTSIELDVVKGERFRLQTQYGYWQRAYAFVNSANTVVSVYPDNNTSMPLDIVDLTIEIPDGVTKLRVSSYKYNIDNIQRYPVLKLTQYDNTMGINGTSFISDVDITKIFSNVLFIGDSLTEGAYYNSSTLQGMLVESYPYFMGKINGWTVTNGGKSGFSASNWYTTEIQKYTLSNYDTFVIWLGTNNGFTDTLDIDCIGDDYTLYANTETGYYCKIIGKILEDNPNANIFLLTTYASKDNNNVNNIVLAKIADKYSVPLFDMNDGTLYPNNILHPNGNSVHFGVIGNIAVATKLSNYIKNYILTNPSLYEKGTLV